MIGALQAPGLPKQCDAGCINLPDVRHIPVNIRVFGMLSKFFEQMAKLIIQRSQCEIASQCKAL